MAEVEFSGPALNNLRSIHEYISKDSELYADNVIRNIIKRARVLELHAHIGKVVPEFKNLLIRELIEGNYRIIYEIQNENKISILRIYHSARLLKKL